MFAAAQKKQSEQQMFRHVQHIQGLMMELGALSMQGKLEGSLAKATQAEKYIKLHFGKDEYGFKSRVNMFRAIAYIHKGRDLRRLAREVEAAQHFGLADKLLGPVVKHFEALIQDPAMEGGPVDMLATALRSQIQLKALT
jgi:hypothetical protein